MSTATPIHVHPEHERLAVTLAELLSVIAQVTPDEDEIVATMLYMVDARRVRLIEPPLAF
jgi:hypothetical protein